MEWSKNCDLRDDARDQYRCLVRYFKRWRNLRYSENEKKPFSVGLTIMIRDCYSESFNSDGEADDLDALIQTITNILSHGYFVQEGEDKYDLVVNLPVLPYTDVFKDQGTVAGTKLHNRLVQLKNRLLKAQEQTALKATCSILAETYVFGDDFPVPDDDEGGTRDSTKKYTITGGAVGTPQGA